MGRRDLGRRFAVERLEDRDAPATLSVGNLAGDLVILDTAGVVNDMTMSVASGNLIITDATEQFDGTGGFAGASLSNGDKTLSIPLTSLAGASVSLDGAAGNDTLTINALPGFDSGLTIGSPTHPLTNVTFAGAVNLPAGKNLSVSGGTITVSAAVSTAGGAMQLSATENITLNSPLATGGGALTLNADSDSDGTGTLSIDLPLAEFVDPNPNPGNQFGLSVVPLPNGNVVITSPFDDFGGTDAGAVYLFNGATGSLISTLRGSSVNDQIGNGGVTVLSNGNYVVRSSNWDNGAATNAGAVTWGSGTTGISGVVSASNSLVGGTTDDYVGGSDYFAGGVMALSNGNYVVRSSNWDNGAATNAGAVTWGSGTTGVAGVVSASNSLVGSTANDRVGYLNFYPGYVIALSNGNYVISSSNWDNGAVTDAGAVTWGSGATGVTGVISASNSLVGTTAYDHVGSGGATALSNGNYVTTTSYWDNGALTDAGAITWGSGATGIAGVVSASNSLVGGTANDRVGAHDYSLSGVMALINGNYLAISPHWDNGAATDAGAVTWGSGATGVAGVVSASNSLVGNMVYDRVGAFGVTALSNGNYVVRSFAWNLGKGAATWGSGTTGVAGVVSASNSLVGSKVGDQVGGYEKGITALSNGNYVVSSPWDDGATTDVGAVTWGNGATGIVGFVSASNSLVGSKLNDRIGSDGVTALSNGNYVVRSTNWDNGAAIDAGAVTWGNGATGTKGVVSASNSLVGSKFGDRIGSDGVTALSNGGYVVSIPDWDNGTATSAGAVTWGSGTTGVAGVISASNSLVGSKVSDRIGSGGVTALSNGNYVVNSYNWASVGAVTWGNGATGIKGVVSASNSLVGSTDSDDVGIGGVTALSNGNYVVSSYDWDNGAATNAGAVTWGSGTTGVAGVVSASNSLVGSKRNDAVSKGSVTALSNGNYIVRSQNWDSGATTNAGAVTWGSGTTGVAGVVSASNSLVGNTASAGLDTLVIDDDGRYFARFLTEGGGRVRVGSTVSPFFGPLYAGDVTLYAGMIGGVLPLTDGNDIAAASTTFAPGSALTIDIAGTTADSQYTRLKIAGSVNLANAALNLTGAFVPNTGDVFTIVSATSRSGFFSNRADGSTFPFNGVPVRIDYTATAVTLTVISAPVITNIAPFIGPTTGGFSVTITGSNFAGATTVTFGSTVVTIPANVSDTTIVVAAPSSTTVGDVLVTVTTPNGTSTPTAFTPGIDQITYLPTKLTGVVIDDGSGQRGVVRSITLNFDAAVQSAPASAFAITDQADNPIAGLIVGVAGVGTSSLTLTFSDASAVDLGPVTYGSLADGLYRLKVDGALLTSLGAAVDADGDGQAGGTSSTDFTRLFGDVNGDGFMDALDIYPHLINAIDTLEGAPGYNVAFDYDGDGDVDAVDIYPHIITRIDTGV